MKLRIAAYISSVGYWSLDVRSANSELNMKILDGLVIWHLKRIRWIIMF